MRAESITRLFDREPPADYLAENARHFAAAKTAQAKDDFSVFVFRLGEEWLALPASVLVEVAEARGIHSLPHRRGSTVLGLTSLRGELLITVSLAELLGIAAGAGMGRAAAPPRLVVVQREGSRLAFPVDAVDGVRRHARSELQALPPNVAGASASYARAILPLAGRRVGCLDDELLFHTLNRSLA